MPPARRTLLWAVLCTLLLAIPLGAAQPLVVPDELNGKPIGLHMDLLKDPEGRLDIEDVSRGPASANFTPSPWACPNFGFTRDAIWARLQVLNAGDRPQPFLLEVAHPLLDHVELYVRQGNGWERRPAGDHLPFHEREVRYRTFLFHLEAGPHSTAVYYLRFQSTSSMDLQMAAWSNQTFLENANAEMPVLGLFFGILLSMALFNLIVFLATRDRNYLYLALVLLHGGLFNMIANGMAYQYLWPDWVWWGNYSIQVVIAFANFWINRFTRTFLETSRTMPAMDRYLKALQWTCLGLAPPLLIAPFAVGIQAYVILSFVTVASILAAGFMSLFQGNRTARIFLVAWMGLILGNGALSLKTYGILPDVFFTRWSSHLGLAFLALVISLALVDRMHILKRDLEALNRDLDRIVQKRTQELGLKNQELVRVNEQKNQFLGIVAHDLRNPLNGIVLATELLDGEKDPGEVTRVARQIRKEGMEMSTLIGRFLDIAAIESGRIKAEPTEFHLGELAAQMATHFEHQAETKGIALRVEPPWGECRVRADLRFTKEALDNLISNALKFSPKGTRVTVRLEQREDRVILSVEDQGPGLTADDKARLFGRFARLSAQPTGGEKSIGLGLSIVKHMVDAMEGRIWVDSEPGQGATFRVELPGA